MYASLEDIQRSATTPGPGTCHHFSVHSRWLESVFRFLSGLEGGKATSDRNRHPGSDGGEWRLAVRIRRVYARLMLEGDAASDDAVFALVASGRRVLASGARNIFLDLRGVHEADTRLIASLVLLHREARRKGKRVVLRTSRCVCEWARVCRVEGLLNLVAAPRPCRPVPAVRPIDET